MKKLKDCSSKSADWKRKEQDWTNQGLMKCMKKSRLFKKRMLLIGGWDLLD